MKTVTIGDISFSKAICGTNAFYGRSHFSAARDAEYQARFDEAYITRALEACLKWGINTIETSANERIDAILAALRLQHQKPLYCIGSTRIDETSAMKSHNQKLEYLIERRAAICVIHAQFVENAERDGAIPGLERMLEKVRATGLLTAVSAHRISTVELCERKGYPIDTYLFPLNSTGFVYPGYEGSETVADRIDLVKGISKPLILMKVLGAGRIPPEEGLQFAAENSKPNDLISLGFGSIAEIDETMKVFEKIFKGQL